ncbi:MAG: hypothetical protein H8E37_00405 [Planctomycetes bacterium]|nr:hypothetical protein [Planctomycetota bacterium]
MFRNFGMISLRKWERLRDIVPPYIDAVKLQARQAVSKAGSRRGTGAMIRISSERTGEEFGAPSP